MSVSRAKTAALAVAALAGCVFFGLLFAGRRGGRELLDRPRLTPGVALRDLRFYSRALGREMAYRAVLPARVPDAPRLPVAYLLHGAGGAGRNWTSYSDVARFAEQGLILVMPDAGSSYYVNAVEKPQDRYEDYIVSDLIPDVETRLPAAPGRGSRAVVGVSMGGYGAVKLALSHPELFAFAGGMSSAIDVPTRRFAARRFLQYRRHAAIFGPWGSSERRARDPFVLARTADAATSPYFFLSCGDREGLLPSNRRFAELLADRRIRHEFHVVRGGHDWYQWDAQLATVFASLREHLDRPTLSRQP
jgi:S-formylglutathione hydrolase FrmB